MKTNNTQATIIAKVKEILKIDIKDIRIPPQGMDSEVFFITDKDGQEYAVKHGLGADSDVLAYDLLKANNIKVPIPKMFGNFVVGNKPVIILEKIKFPLLETVPVNQMSKYIPSMVANLKEIHKIKSTKMLPWKDILSAKFSGSNSNLNWKEISKRKGLNESLVLNSVEKIIKTINQTYFINESNSFLHTDFNQRNLFVDPKSNDITGIIDWGEAMFGDPIYDFSRIRMLIWHFDLGEAVIEKYYKLMAYAADEKKLDDLYWLSRVIEYLAYYSEELNEFDIGRIKLHQDFLANYSWEQLPL